MFALSLFACSDYGLEKPALVEECGVSSRFNETQWRSTPELPNFLQSKKCNNLIAVRDEEVWGYIALTELSDPASAETLLYSKWGKPTHRFQTEPLECGPMGDIFTTQFLTFLSTDGEPLKCGNMMNYVWVLGDTAVVADVQGEKLNVFWMNTRKAPFRILRGEDKL